MTPPRKKTPKQRINPKIPRSRGPPPCPRPTKAVKVANDSDATQSSEVAKPIQGRRIRRCKEHGTRLGSGGSCGHCVELYVSTSFGFGKRGRTMGQMLINTDSTRQRAGMNEGKQDGKGKKRKAAEVENESSESSESDDDGDYGVWYPGYCKDKTMDGDKDRDASAVAGAAVVV